MWNKLVATAKRNLSQFLLFVIAIVPLTTLSYFLLYDNYQYRHLEEEQKNEQMAKVLAQNVDSFIAGIKATLNSIAGLDVIQERDRAEIEKAFASLAVAQHDVSLFWMTDANGDVIAKWPDNAPDKSAAGKDFFSAAMRGATFVSDDLTGEITNKEIVLVAVPYTDNRGKILGVLGASIPLEKLQQKLDLRIGATGYPILVSKSGKFLVHPQLNEIRKKVGADDPVWRALRSGASGTINVVAPFDGQRKLFSYVPLHEADWVVVVVQPLSEFNAKLYNLFARYGVVIVVVLVVVLWAARQLVLARHREEEARILQAEKLAVVGQLAAGMAHEIRNPLTSIKGFVQMMASREDGKAPPEYLEMILMEIESIQSVVDETLVLAKPHPANFVPVNLGEVIQEVCSLMKSQALFHNIRLVCSFSLDIPPVNANRNQLKQVFINLIKNSIDAMPEAGGEISLTLKQRGQKLQIAVSDTGSGIPPELVAKLGSPFVTTKENGTGLGLMVTFRIIQNHGGTIKVDSAPGQGATFVITLPIVKPESRF